mgnify:CR=1 FL=1
MVSVYNVYVNAYYASFGTPTSTFEVSIDVLVETLFFFDMLFCFLQEYKDDETYSMVSSFKLIALHYVKKSFFFDFIAIIPFDFIINHDADQNFELFRVIKLLRIPRLIDLLEVEKWKSRVKNFYSN